MRFDQMQDCKNTHAGIFKFNCPHCEYKTNKSKALANHITTHRWSPSCLLILLMIFCSAAKPWICPICQHTSSTTSNLNNHIKKVHKVTLCQAEMMTKRSRYGREMTEDEVEQNRIAVQVILSLNDSLLIWASKKKKVIAHVTWNGGLTGLYFVQWGADRRQTDQDDGIPSFDWNHGKNGRIGYRRKVRGQHGGYFVFLVHIGV